LQLHDIIARLRGDTVTTGIDVGHYSIKLVTVEHSRSGANKLVAADLEVLPEGVVVDNEIRDSRALSEALSNLLTRAAPGGVRGDLVVSVNWTSGVLCDRVNVKLDKGRNEDEAILQSAMSRSPFDDTDNVLDYEILHRREDSSVEALVVAAKNNMLNNWASFFNIAGLKPVAIDIDAFAACNTYYSSPMSLQDPEQSVVLFNMGEKKAHLSFLRGGVFQTARVVQSGSFDNALQLVSRNLGLDTAACRAILQGKKKDGFDPAMLQGAMEYVCEEVSMGVEIALRYFSAMDASAKQMRVLLTGGGASLPGLAQKMSERLSMPVSLLQPFDSVDYDITLLDGIGGDLAAVQNIFAPALGLALRRF